MAIKKAKDFKGQSAEYWAIVRKTWNKLEDTTSCSLALYFNRQARLASVKNILDKVDHNPLEHIGVGENQAVIFKFFEGFPVVQAGAKAGKQALQHVARRNAFEFCVNCFSSQSYREKQTVEQLGSFTGFNLELRKVAVLLFFAAVAL